MYVSWKAVGAKWALGYWFLVILGRVQDSQQRTRARRFMRKPRGPTSCGWLPLKNLQGKMGTMPFYLALTNDHFLRQQCKLFCVSISISLSKILDISDAGRLRHNLLAGKLVLSCPQTGPSRDWSDCLKCTLFKLSSLHRLKTKSNLTRLLNCTPKWLIQQFWMFRFLLVTKGYPVLIQNIK